MAFNDEVFVIGNGLAGLAACILLSRDHGFKVTIFDSSADATNLQVSQQFETASLPLAQLALLDSISPTLQVEMNRQSSHGCAAVAALYKEARKAIATSSAIDIKFGRRLKKFDVKARTLTFINSCGEEESVDASRVRVLDSYSLLTSSLGQIGFFGDVCDNSAHARDSCLGASFQSAKALLDSRLSVKTSCSSWPQAYNESEQHAFVEASNVEDDDDKLCFVSDTRQKHDGQTRSWWLSMLSPMVGA